MPAGADAGGTPVGVVHLDPELSYVGVGALLRVYVDAADEGAWAAIRAKIDYTFEHLDLALGPLDAETGFGQ